MKQIFKKKDKIRIEEFEFIRHEEKERKNKLIRYTLIITFPLTFYYALMYFYNQAYENAAIQMFCALGFVLLFILQLRGVSHYPLGIWYGIFGAISIYATNYYSGGIYAVGLAWVAFHPLVQLLLSGKKVGLFWVGMNLFYLFVLTSLHMAGHVFPPIIPKLSSNLESILNGMIGLLGLIILVGVVFENSKNSALIKLARKNNLVVEERERSENLLLNILPQKVATELKEKGVTTAQRFEDVSVLFFDVKGFTLLAEFLTPEELVGEIHTYFSAFDVIVEAYGLEKIKTIGDAYMAAGGLSETSENNHAINVINAALEIVDKVEEYKKLRITQDRKYFEFRAGIHNGPVVAGVVGTKKFQYDMWGDTVNLASRMEQESEAGKINISHDTFTKIKEHFECHHRGKVKAKNKGSIDMYFVSRKK